MAVTAIWDIKGRVDKVISYATNPQKTDASAMQYAADLHAIERVVEYTADEMKTAAEEFVLCTKIASVEKYLTEME